MKMDWIKIAKIGHLGSVYFQLNNGFSSASARFDAKYGGPCGEIIRKHMC